MKVKCDACKFRQYDHDRRPKYSCAYDLNKLGATCKYRQPMVFDLFELRSDINRDEYYDDEIKNWQRNED